MYIFNIFYNLHNLDIEENIHILLYYLVTEETKTLKF